MKKRGLIALLFTLIFCHISAVESLDYLVFTFERIQQTSIHRLKTQKVTEYYYWITPMPRSTMDSLKLNPLYVDSDANGLLDPNKIDDISLMSKVFIKDDLGYKVKHDYLDIINKCRERLQTMTTEWATKHVWDDTWYIKETVNVYASAVNGEFIACFSYVNSEVFDKSIRIRTYIPIDIVHVIDDFWESKESKWLKSLRFHQFDFTRGTSVWNVKGGRRNTIIAVPENEE